jgi:UDP-glucose 4-epimerase
MRTFIVTGGAGFIGSHIASRLISSGDRVVVLDNLSTGRADNIPSQAEFIEVDLGQDNACDCLKRINCDAIFHLAGQSSGEASFLNPRYDLRSHVVSTFNLLEWAKEKRVERFLYASSMSVYGDPLYWPVDVCHQLRPKTYYGAAKNSAEAYINFYGTRGINTTIFRMFSVYGPGQNLDNRMQGMVSIYFSYFLDRVPVVVKGAKARFRDFIYIDDVVDAWTGALYKESSFGKTYNLCSGIKTSVEELLNTMMASLNYDEYPISYTGGTPGDQFGMVGDNSLIKEDLGWTPRVKLADGLKKMVELTSRFDNV